jgi:predicted DCC family thiol-disulfide oxidoreductase YuxK
MKQHLILYDSDCMMCDQRVKWLFKRDRKHIFFFSPLQEETAKMWLGKLPPEPVKIDSLILIEEFRSSAPQLLLRGKAILRILWLLGGAWTVVGVLHFLPSCLYDWAYRIIARHRHRFNGSQQCQLPDPNLKDRFLP